MDPTLPEAVPNAAPRNEQTPPAPGLAPGSAEVAPNTAAEQPHEGPAPVRSGSNAATPVAPQPIQAMAQQPMNDPAASSAISDDPVIADDVDVIEKEWVDKAKKIVNGTKEDPYQQEKQVSKLQADYLMKRYNKQVKLSE